MSADVWKPVEINALYLLCHAKKAGMQLTENLCIRVCSVHNNECNGTPAAAGGPGHHSAPSTLSCVRFWGRKQRTAAPWRLFVWKYVTHQHLNNFTNYVYHLPQLVFFSLLWSLVKPPLLTLLSPHPILPLPSLPCDLPTTLPFCLSSPSPQLTAPPSAENPLIFSINCQPLFHIPCSFHNPSASFQPASHAYIQDLTVSFFSPC